MHFVFEFIYIYIHNYTESIHLVSANTNMQLILVASGE